MNQRLIRFDVRLHKDDYVDKFWTPANRNRFLLRPGTDWPLSIDPLVWPSVFFSRIFRDATKIEYGNIEVSPATDEGKYWLSLEQMRAYYRSHKQPGDRGVLVAIHIFSELSLAENIVPYMLADGIQCALTFGDVDPCELPTGSEFLGYDVADASWISGLTNCEYTLEEHLRLAPMWGTRLNSFGLLKDIGDAMEFKEISDKRVPEHSPFWIYGISRLP